MNDLTHGSLFSGIGGFELGAQMSGIKTIWNCEIEEKQRPFSDSGHHFFELRQQRG